MTPNLMLGDCLDLLPDLPDNSIDLILTDLPYGITQCKWDSVIPLELLWAQYKRILKENGTVVLHARQPFTTDLICSNREWFKYCWVWHKKRVTGFLDAGRKPLRATEDIVVFYAGKANYRPQKRGGGEIRVWNRVGKADHYSDQTTRLTGQSTDGMRYPTDLLEFKTERGFHPTQKPVALAEYLIRTYTDEDDVVLDNAMGSGTTMLACQNTKRQGIGMEIDEAYFAIAKERILPKKENPGESDFPRA